MAKVSGILKFTGTIGGINLYLRKGVPTARRAGGGFSGKAIKTSPNMVRVRENGSEFKGCLQCVRDFKAGLAPYFSMVKNGESHQRLVSLFTKIKDADITSVRGARHVGGGMQTADGRHLLKNHVFNGGHDLTRILGCPFDFTIDEGLRITGFSKETVKFPAGATHLELMPLLYVFDFENSLGVLQKGETASISKKDQPESDLILPLSAVANGSGTQIGLIYHRFLQDINGAFYPLKSEGSSGLEVVFVA